MLTMDVRDSVPGKVEWLFKQWVTHHSFSTLDAVVMGSNVYTSMLVSFYGIIMKFHMR